MSSNTKPSNETKEKTKVSTEKPIVSMVEAKADSASTKAVKAIPGKNDFVKDLFQTVQGVKYDDRCPHGLPYYACMSCSH